MRIFLTLLVLCALVGCSSSKKDEEGPPPPVETLYNEGKDLLAKREFKLSIEKFERLEREYPFSEWARRAKLMSAYAAYERGDYVDSEVMLESYIKLYPASEDTDYAYYLKALTYYEQITDTRRDQENTTRAKQALLDVIRRYPGTSYAKDGKVKLDLVNDHLAGKEMEIGRYYLERQNYVPAINRFNDVLTSYQTTSHVPEALHRLVECYMALGLIDDARRSAAVLGFNFPGSDWYRDSYRLVTGDTTAEPVRAEDTSWWNSVKSSVKKLF